MIPAFPALVSALALLLYVAVFANTGRLRLTFQDQEVADLSMDFLHNGRPPVVREASWQTPAPSSNGQKTASDRPRRG